MNLIYKTNSGLGYNEYAILLKISENEFLCIDYYSKDKESYVVGELVDDLDYVFMDFFDDYDITESPLYNTFLFQYFLQNRNK